MKTPLKTLTCMAVAAGLTIGSAPAMAGDAPRKTAQIETADLNLDTPAGQKSLERRIHRAAKQVCNVGSIRTHTRLRSQKERACYAKATASAKRQVAAMNEKYQIGG